MATKAYVEIHGRNKTDRAFNKVQGNVSKLDNSFKKLNSGIAAFGLGVAITKMASLGKGAIDTADAVEKLSRRSGQSARMISEMGFALSQNDATMADYGNSLRNINKNTQNAVDGLQTQSRAFGKLGISVSAFSKLNSDQKFIQLSEAISRIEDPSIRTQVAMDIMGRAGERLLPVMENGAAGIAKYREKAIELGQSLSEDQVKAAAAASDALDELSKSISGAFLQSVVTYSDKVSGLAKFFQETIPVAIGATVSAFNTIGPAIIPAISAFAAIKVSIAVWTALSAAVAGSSLTLSMFTTRAGLATVASASMTGAVGLLRGAMSLLGGPVGVIALVVGALAIFISRSQAAQKASSDFISSINKGTAVKLNDSLEKTSRIILNLEADLAKAKKELSEATSTFSVFGNGTLEAGMKVQQLENELRAANKASLVITKQIAEQEKQTKLLSDSTNDAGDSFSSLTGVIGENTTTVITNKSAFKGAKKLMDGYVGSIQDLINKSRDAANVFGEYNSAAETVDAAILQNIKTGVRYDKVLEELHKRFPEGTRGSKEYKEAIKTLGLETEKTTTVMAEYWERFANGAFDSFKTFTKSAFTDFKSFGDSLKNLAKDIVSDLIATFASNKLKDIFKNLFSGGEGASSGGFLDSIKDVFGGGSDSGVSGIFKSLFGGTTSEVGPTQPGAISGLFASGGLFSSTGKIGGLFAKGGLFGSGGSIAEGFASLTELINPYTAAIAAVIAIGGPLISKIFKSGARSPQQLGLDQLQEVSDRVSRGEITQTREGFAGDTAVSALGAFDKNSIFFGVDLARDKLQEVGEVFKQMTGAKQARALKDGIIRIEDFNTDVIANQGTIIAQLKASIIQVELGITDSEKSIISSIGGSLVELDKLFDASAGNGETAAERLAAAYSEATNSNIQAGQDWVTSSGIDADRIAQIFDTTSGSVTAALFGITDVGVNAFNQMTQGAEMFSTNILGLNGILNTVDLGVAQGQINIPNISSRVSNTVPANSSNNRVNQPPSQNGKDIASLTNQVSRLVDSQTSNNIKQQPIYGT